MRESSETKRRAEYKGRFGDILETDDPKRKSRVPVNSKK